MSKKNENQILEVKFQSLFHKEARSVFRKFVLLFSICIFLIAILLVNQFVDLKSLIIEKNIEQQTDILENDHDTVIDINQVSISGYLGKISTPQKETISNTDFINVQKAFIETDDSLTSQKRYPILDISGSLDFNDWQELSNSLVDKNNGIAVLRATQGNSLLDNGFYKNWSFASANFKMIGAYHIFDPNIDAQSQTKHFINTVPIRKGDLTPVIFISKNTNLTDQSALLELEILLQAFSDHYGAFPILAISNNHSVALTSKFEKAVIWNTDKSFEQLSATLNSEEFIQNINHVGFLKTANPFAQAGISFVSDTLIKKTIIQ